MGVFNREVVAEDGMNCSDDVSGSVTFVWSEHEKRVGSAHTSSPGDG